MKKFTILFALLVVFALSTTAQVAINADNSNPASSAMLDVKSTTKGMLVPRMTQGQMVGITSPADGLLVYNLTKHALYIYSSANKQWREVSMGSGIASTSVVTNTTTGRTWMDRNLGASEVATSSTDAQAYGDLYQWGRSADGHEKRNSATYSSLATSPGRGNAWDGKFILSSSDPYDWLQTQDDNLWQGVNGVNNPCPAGFRLPTQSEWTAERDCWSSQNDVGAISSELKVPLPGYREYDGSFSQVGTMGFYWTSTVCDDGTYKYSDYLRIYSSAAYVAATNPIFQRGRGASVRCILDE